MTESCVMESSPSLAFSRCFAIIPNYVYDPDKTEQKRQEAADSVQQVQIKQGQILVEENQLIDREVYRLLHAVSRFLTLLLRLVRIVYIVGNDCKASDFIGGVF